MRFDYKKIASVLASAAMLTSTVGFAAAAAYPAPFSSTGGVVVYGANAAKTDIIAAIKVSESVKGTTSVSATTTTSGETSALFTSSSKINVNDSLNQVKTVLTESATDGLPTVLKKNTFSGNVDATITQTIDLGVYPKLVFAKMPTSSDDPAFGFQESTSTSNYIYNATASFSKAVNFNDSNSKNQEITLFGQKFNVGAGTDSTNLILFKSASKLNFDSTGVTSGEVTINGKKYTLELITASTTTATISVTAEDGTSEQKEITEGYSKKVNGITIAVNTADSNNQKYTASIVAGADKVTLTSGSAVTVGDAATNIDGTLVTFTGTVGALTKIVVSVAAVDSEHDALKPGDEFVDPVFGSFKLSFKGGLNIADTSEGSRENITVKSAGDDKLQFTMTNDDADTATVQFVKTRTAGGLSSPADLQVGDDGINITVAEGAPVYKGEYVVLGNEDNGYLLKVSITNSSSDYAGDYVKLTNVFDTSETFQSAQTAEGVGTVTIGGKVYGVRYFANNGASQDNWNVSLDYADSSSTGQIVLYPTIQSSKGAKVFLYEPLTINLANYSSDIGGTFASRVTGFRLPNGNGYTDVTVAPNSNTTLSNRFDITGSSSGSLDTNVSGTDLLNITVGQVRYSFSPAGVAGQVIIRLQMPSNGVWADVANPAIGLIEEKDDNSQYHAVVISTKLGTTSTNATAVSDVLRTWGADVTFNGITLASNSNKVADADLFGTIITKDSGDSNHPWAVINYPDEQIFAQVYVGANEATITPGGDSGSVTGSLIAIEDSEIATAKDKNIIIVGGSCVNTVAAKILGSDAPLCGADFTAKTEVGAGQYIIKTIKASEAVTDGSESKIAVLVAGYEAADTQNAVNTLLAGAATDVGSSKVYPELAAG